MSARGSYASDLMVCVILTGFLCPCLRLGVDREEELAWIWARTW